MVTELPLEALSPAAGSCLATTPVSLVLEYVVSSTYQNPAADSSALASAAVTPARSGDFTPESIFQIAWPANPAATMAKMVTATFIPHASRLRPEGSPGAGVRLPLSALHMTAPRAFPASPPLAFVEDRAPVGTWAAKLKRVRGAFRPHAPVHRHRLRATSSGYLAMTSSTVLPVGTMTPASGTILTTVPGGCPDPPFCLNTTPRPTALTFWAANVESMP